MTTTRPRYPIIDQLRGFAIALMVIYHFCYDLTYFNIVQFDFQQDMGWRGFRTFIITLFLLVAGISMMLARQARVSTGHQLKRLLVLAASALAITLLSFYMFPQRPILFGILHLIAFASVLGLLMVRAPWLSLVCGIIMIVAGNVYAHPMFNGDALYWVGFTSIRPATEDYVPVFPWAGIVLVGIGLGHTLTRDRQASGILQLALPKNRLTSGLGKAGRHSLLIYLVHQPILFPLVGGLHWLFFQ